MFRRERQRLHLNERGWQLLDAVRLAMRLADDAMQASTTRRAVRVFAPPHLAGLISEGTRLGGAERNPLAALRSGRVDIVLGHGDEGDLEDDLVCMAIGTLVVHGAKELARIEVRATRRRPLSPGDDLIASLLTRMAADLARS